MVNLKRISYTFVEFINTVSDISFIFISSVGFLLIQGGHVPVGGRLPVGQSAPGHGQTGPVMTGLVALVAVEARGIGNLAARYFCDIGKRRCSSHPIAPVGAVPVISWKYSSPYFKHAFLHNVNLK